MEFNPVAWNPPRAPAMNGDFRRNTDLVESNLIDIGGDGPEDVVIDEAGRIVAGLVDGRIMRCQPDGSELQTLADTGGRPLGIELGHDGGLIICDAEKGLLSLSAEGQLRTLATACEGAAFRFTNNAAVAQDGTIYFTDSSANFGIADYVKDLMEHAGTGRLLAHRPTGETEVLLHGLHFANGVALSPNEDYLLVVETARYLIRKYWLSGPHVGESETFVDNLPGFPDNLSRHGDIYWVALPTLRSRPLDWMLPRPGLRKIVARLPAWMQPGIIRHGFALGINEQGQVVHNLQDATGRVAVVTGVRQHENRLFLGSLVDQTVAVYELPVP